MLKKRYIVTQRLKRKNGRRKILYKFRADNEHEAIRTFKREVQPDITKEYELLTGDWKHLCFLEGGEG